MCELLFYQVLVCNECTISLHKLPNHECEHVSDVECRYTDELKSIMTETKGKVYAFEGATGSVESLLSDLQQQRDFAHDLIKETYQSYKALLEKRKVGKLIIFLIKYFFSMNIKLNVQTRGQG